MVSFLSNQKLLDIPGKRGYNNTDLPLFCGWLSVSLAGVVAGEGFSFIGQSSSCWKTALCCACERVEGYSSSVSAGTNSSPEKS